MSITLNGLPCIGVMLSIPGTGAWIAEVDFDLGTSLVVPSGKAVLVVGATTLVGTIDERSTGRQGTRANVQVVAGGGGWDKSVHALHYKNDFGVTSTQVYSTTAASVGEVVLEQAPGVFGPDFPRTAGRASRVLDGTSWYLDANGITNIGIRPSPPLATGATILTFEPETRVAHIASDEIVWPGTVLTDTRFGTARIRDVEQVFGVDGARVTAWCEVTAVGLEDSQGSKLVRALATVARESIGLPYLKTYRYRVTSEGVDGRLTLQLVDTSLNVPAFLTAVEVWDGVVSIHQKITPGSIVVVAFLAQPTPQPAIPVVVGFDPSNPPAIEVSCDALRIAFGLALNAVAMSPGVLAAINALQAQVTALMAGLAAVQADPTHIASATAVTAASTAVTSGSSAVSTAVATIPSIRTFTD